MTSAMERGDELENKFHQYLVQQKSRGDFVYGAYPSDLCRIYKKKRYYCREREGDVEFDIVIELFRQGRDVPHLCVVFECKNYESAIPEREITDFSHKLNRIFPHNAKGVIVISSRLQSGAEHIAQKRGIGIVRYDKHGFEIVADRVAGKWIEDKFVKTQIVNSGVSSKSMRFSAYYDGEFTGSIDDFLLLIIYNLDNIRNSTKETGFVSVPYIDDDQLKRSAQQILEQINYKDGPVDLIKICSILPITLQHTDERIRDGDGNLILGSVNFDRNLIVIYQHGDRKRERFTIAHEIGHFCLRHDRYLRSQYISERDLFIAGDHSTALNFERLEIQANIFASYLLLPEDFFLERADIHRKSLEIRDRGHGYIFVDDQPCNLASYYQLLTNLSSDFVVSMQVVEIKLKNLGMLTDQRRNPERLSVTPIIPERGW